ncbi:MAG: xanthine dehydrogenase family protein subunit M [Albidovulum sp.]|nr:xanthine dehydrogenase family protein subunit M [Albidovulum sp.]
MYDFEVARPSTIAEAASALSAEGAQVLGGGHTLIPTLKNRLARPSVLVSVSRIDEMRGVRVENEKCLCVGGAATHAEVASSAEESFPALAWLAGNIGDPAVRNRGTVGGSLANNDPSACYPAAALAVGATIETNNREIAADDFFRGMFETELKEGEIITKVRFPIPDAGNYQKFEQPASRFALVGVFLAQFGSEVRIGVTGASESGVFRWADAEAALSADFSTEAANGLPAAPGAMINDLHGSGEYRAHLMKVLTARAVAAAS